MQKIEFQSKKVGRSNIVWLQKSNKYIKAFPEQAYITPDNKYT